MEPHGPVSSVYVTFMIHRTERCSGNVNFILQCLSGFGVSGQEAYGACRTVCVCYLINCEIEEM